MFLLTMNAKTDSFSVGKNKHSLYPIPLSPDLPCTLSVILLQLINFSFANFSKWEHPFLITDLYQTHMLDFAEHLEPIHLLLQSSDSCLFVSSSSFSSKYVDSKHFFCNLPDLNRTCKHEKLHMQYLSEKKVKIQHRKGQF